MRLLRPTTVDDAVAALASHPDARCLAGGQTLVAMMNADLVQPAALVSLRGIASLQGFAVAADGTVAIGAMTTHAAVAAFSGFRGAQQIVGAAARQIAHVPIRNAGTIGGSVSHAEPAADFPTALLAADAEIEIAGPAGRRRVAAADFFVDYLQTVLEAGEMVVAVHVPPAPAGARYHYDKLTRAHGDFAIASIALVLGYAPAEGCSYARLTAGGCGPTPLRSVDAEACLVGSSLTEADIAAAAAELVAIANPMDDFRGSAAYRRKVLSRLARQAIATLREESRR